MLCQDCATLYHHNLASYKKPIFVPIGFRTIIFLPQQSRTGTIHILRQQKDWMGGVGKWPFLMTIRTVLMPTQQVDGSEKVQKYAEVIKGWSHNRICLLQCVTRSSKPFKEITIQPIDNNLVDIEYQQIVQFGLYFISYKVEEK